MSRLKSGASAADRNPDGSNTTARHTRQRNDRCRTGIAIPDQLEGRDIGRGHVICEACRSEDLPVYVDPWQISAIVGIELWAKTQAAECMAKRFRSGTLR